MDKIQEYTLNNFTRCIYDFLVLNCNSKTYNSIELEDLRFSIEEDILSRIMTIVKNCKYFYFENEYVETSWKEMVSMHYINTSYTLGKNVARVHFMSEKNFSKDSYLGNITLRPIEETRIMLSFVYPNYNNLLKNECKNILGYEKVIHVDTFKIPIRTFPFFSQDGIVARCAHADILMLTIYLNHVYRYKKINISDMYSNENRLMRFPSFGLNKNEINEVFLSNEVPIKVHEIENFINYPNEEKEKIIKQIEEVVYTNLQSLIPVILGIQDHVILFIGVEESEKKEREYFYYDDSAFWSGESKNGNSFLSKSKWNFFMKEIIEKKVSENEKKFNKIELGNLFVPQHERVYMDSMEYIKNINDFLESPIEEINEHNEVEKKSMKDLFFRLFEKEFSQKHYLIDISNLKEFVMSIKSLMKDEDSLSHAETLLNLKMPHYIWTTELYVNDDTVRVLLYCDPTLHTFSRIEYIGNSFMIYNTNDYLQGLSEYMLKK